jgi:guanosine-3',5'-bis(diphosphate) 3'-pyrophosphohydrolase
METQTLYQKAIKFATAKHLEQKQVVPGTELPYVVHLSNVAMEILVAGSQTDPFDLGFAVQVALLHDTLEDTATTFEELAFRFGYAIAEAVSALSKDAELPKAQQMADSLLRIKKLRPEVSAVKLADRITNLQRPPQHWDQAKIKRYLEEAGQILAALREGNAYLARRLEGKIMEYAKTDTSQTI